MYLTQYEPHTSENELVVRTIGSDVPIIVRTKL